MSPGAGPGHPVAQTQLKQVRSHVHPLKNKQKKKNSQTHPNTRHADGDQKEKSEMKIITSQSNSLALFNLKSELGQRCQGRQNSKRVVWGGGGGGLNSKEQLNSH